jgi:hypothetical protein
LQGALPNIRSLFTGDDRSVDGGNVFFTAAGYRFKMEEGAGVSSVEPKVSYRGVKGYDNILDLGVNVGFLNNVASAMGMYHTSKSVTAGLSVNIFQVAAVHAFYTSQTGGIKTYVDGTFEVGATINLFRGGK